MKETDRKFRIEDLTFGTLDFNDLSWGEIEDILDYANIDLKRFSAIPGTEARFLEPKVITALLWVENRRNMRGLTTEDIRAIPMDKLADVLSGSGTTDIPKEGSANSTS